MADKTVKKDEPVYVPTPETLLAVACSMTNMPEYHPSYLLSIINRQIEELKVGKVAENAIRSVGDCVRMSQVKLYFDELDYYVIVCPIKALTIGAIEGVEDKEVRCDED